TQGNVWYCGESTQSLATFAGDQPLEPELVEVEGSWKTGRDGAKAGIIMLALPAVGRTYRQELQWGDAEDAAEVLSISATEHAPAGACQGTCLETRDFSPLDAGSGQEHKFWAPGIGEIVAIDLDSGDREELIEFDIGP